MAPGAKRAREKANPPKRGNSLTVLYVIFFLCVVVYAFYNNAFIGLAALLSIIAIIIMETKASVESEGILGSVKEVIVALVGALAIWVALILVLGTQSPINAVASCSMLPTLQRGDLIVLHGISNFSLFASENRIPTVNLTASQFAQLESNINGEFVSFYAYSKSNKSDITDLLSRGEVGYGIGLYNNNCISSFTYLGEVGKIYECYVPNQNSSIIKYRYGLENVTYGGTSLLEVSTNSISILNTTIMPNYTRPIVVYKTTAQDTFSGDIIHRTYAIIDSSGNYYFLTKGDNNQALDIQFGNYPSQSSNILGYVVLDVPVVGYVKLLLSGQLAPVVGCNMSTQIPVQ